jgi:NAD(P)-dependent dehydrogenase (short-subunit alcohol dehydrogenase family)
MSKKVVISGAGRGIGKELVGLFLENGFEVFAGMRNPEDLRLDFPQRQRMFCHVHQLDVTDDTSVNRFAAQLDGIDILINNAGILTQPVALLDDLTLEGVDQMFNVNTLGSLRLAKAFMPKFRKPAGIIANISSLMGSMLDNKSGRCYGYRMSKAALNMVTRCLAADYPDVISVSLHPGWVKTKMGGENAPVEPKESAAGLFQVISNLGKGDSGKFIDFKGRELPW